MDSNIINLLVFSIPEAVLVLNLCLSFLNQKHILKKTLAYCFCIFIYLVFIAPYLKLHMLFMIFYVLTSILAVKILYKLDFLNTLVSYSLAFAIYFAVENIHVQMVFGLTKITSQDFMKFSLFKVVTFYILFAVIFIISIFIRRKKVHIILNTSPFKVGE